MGLPLVKPSTPSFGAQRDEQTLGQSMSSGGRAMNMLYPCQSVLAGEIAGTLACSTLPSKHRMSARLRLLMETTARLIHLYDGRVAYLTLTNHCKLEGRRDSMPGDFVGRTERVAIQ